MAIGVQVVAIQKNSGIDNQEAEMIAELLLISTIIKEPLSAPNHEIRGNKVYILRTDGGYVESFSVQFYIWRRQGLQAVVTDYCGSACTIVLADPKACARPRAFFGFHQARRYDRETHTVLDEVAEHSTEVMWNQYPPRVQAKLGSLKWDGVYIKGTELLPTCK